ncbi:hypothetical protein OKW98_14585 [Pseudomonas sp. KU26590]|uniref:acetyl-CoA carboxylase biotin carboxyl carrier protein n=1 Tax=Pseudomonas sp. KU26590 TaxID=2991051 RepID=UPI00223D947B|nr:biotin/lipoyl-containing protein [Pseudomonas sp. KU26590]UZJ57853.1 hypothetical protein OKW98_14585 [Pseudomonas sp. KU26590]
MHISKIRQIVEWMSSANLAQFELHSGDFSLRLNRPLNSAAGGAAHTAQAIETAAPAPRIGAMATVCGRFLSCHPGRDQAEVQPGDVIAVGAVVGLIQVGDVLLPVTATAAGTVKAFMVEEQQRVDYGTALLSLVHT